jgi:SAM-dependent methyltransferase
MEMGIGSGQASLLQVLATGEGWKNVKSVCELGSQEPLANELTDLFAAFGTSALNGPYAAQDLYEHLGVERYVSIDFNGEHGALKFDLNRNIRSEHYFDEVFDLVTNFGTSEHCFNQYEVFRNIHQLCRRGGYMLHTVPTQGWGRHCFFRYDANFFEDLAAANGYHIMLLKPFMRLKPYLTKRKGDTLGPVFTLCSFVESEVDRVQGQVAGGSPWGLTSRPADRELTHALTRVGKEGALFNITLACIFRKDSAVEFAAPIQGMYRQHAA